MPSKVTIATVALRANVSRQTVSNVLNAPDLVRAETRARVTAAIEELGYRANLAARQMRTGRSRLLAVRINPSGHGVDYSVMDRFLHGLTEAAAPAGYRVILYTAADPEAEIATYDELLATYALDAFVLTDTNYGDTRTAWLREHGVPFITFGRPWDTPELHSWVDVDGRAGTRAATDHLIAAGHRRIAFLGWPCGSAVGDDRRAGWQLAMKAAGLRVTGLGQHSRDGVAGGDRLAREVLQLADPATAAVCVSDQMALGALRHPALSVIGFDDTAVAQAVGLSSVRQPLSSAAAACVSALAGLLADAAAGQQYVLLAPELVIRESVQPISHNPTSAHPPRRDVHAQPTR